MMRRASRTSLLLALIVAGATVAASSARADGCGLKQMASLEIERLPDGRISMPVQLDGQKTKLLLDTGSALASSLFPATVEALKLHPVDMKDRFFDSTGHPISRYVTVKTLDLGSIHIETTQFLEMPVADQPNPDIAGLFGPDILRQVDMEIDPAGGKVNLFAQDHCPGQVVYWTSAFADSPLKILRSGHLIIATMLDGQPLDALIDTGSSATFMSTLGVKRLFGLDPTSPGVEAVPSKDPAQPASYYRYRFKSLSMAGIAIQNPEIVLVPDLMRQSLDKADVATPSLKDEEVKLPDITIGMDILSKLRIYIAYGEKHFYASSAKAK